MGYRQTMFVTWTWLIAAMMFFGLIVYRFANGGLTWLLHSPDSLIATGIIALSAYLAVVFNQATEVNRQRDKEHAESMEAIRVLYRELEAPLRAVERTVDSIDSKVID